MEKEVEFIIYKECASFAHLEKMPMGKNADEELSSMISRSRHPHGLESGTNEVKIGPLQGEELDNYQSLRLGLLICASQ